MAKRGLLINSTCDIKKKILSIYLKKKKKRVLRVCFLEEKKRYRYQYSKEVLDFSSVNVNKHIRNKDLAYAIRKLVMLTSYWLDFHLEIIILVPMDYIITPTHVSASLPLNPIICSYILANPHKDLSFLKNIGMGYQNSEIIQMKFSTIPINK